MYSDPRSRTDMRLCGRGPKQPLHTHRPRNPSFGRRPVQTPNVIIPNTKRAGSALESPEQLSLLFGRNTDREAGHPGRRYRRTGLMTMQRSSS